MVNSIIHSGYLIGQRLPFRFVTLVGLVVVVVRPWRHLGFTQMKRSFYHLLLIQLVPIFQQRLVVQLVVVHFGRFVLVHFECFFVQYFQHFELGQLVVLQQHFGQLGLILDFIPKFCFRINY